MNCDNNTPLQYDEEKNKVNKGTLYLVATPIGNLSDLSPRALKILSEVDFIAAEDTRNSVKLLTHFGIQKPLVSYFQHNIRERGEQITQRLINGESCALITDAGTPAISDPGADIVVLCNDKNIPVSSIPGACACIVALTLSALPTGRFTFEGFLSTNHNERTKHLESLISEKRTMVFHEAPHKLKTTLSDICEYFGRDRQIAICRELTKINEEVMHFSLGDAIEYYKTTDPRGEYVLVLAGNDKSEDDAFWINMSITEHVDHYISLGLTKMDAIKAVAKDRDIAKNTIYKEYL